jgi:hypothetical protein
LSFTRVGPFSFGATVSSTQFNTIDLNVSHSVDKTVAGDTLSGLLGMASTAALVAGISAGSQGMSGAFTTGSIGFGYAPGTTTPVIASGVSAGILSTIQGGIALGGGSNDFPAFATVTAGGAVTGTTRTRTVSQALCPILPPSSWALGGGGLYIFTALENVSDAGGVGVVCPITALHNGATLTGVTIFFAVGAAHSGVPSQLPIAVVTRVPLTPGLGAVPTNQQLSSTGQQSPANPGSGAAWYDSGFVQSWTYMCNQNNVIATGQYAYLIGIYDESSTNSHFTNVYLGISLAYTGIPNMQWP